MNRGVEITTDLADSTKSVILDQVTSGVAIRMAVLYLILGGRVMANDLLIKGKGNKPVNPY